MLVYKDGTCTKEETRAPREGEVVWLRLYKPDAEELQHILGNLYHCHALVIEDCIKLKQRPKLDEYPEHAMITFYSVDTNLNHREIALVIGKQFVISIYHEEIPFLESLREEMMKFPAKMENSGRILYHILDSCVDQYLEVVDKIETRIEGLEQTLYHNPQTNLGQRIFRLKRKLHSLRRTFVEERSVLGSIMHADFSYTREEANVYFMDIYDHLSRVVDSVDSYRESLTGLLELQMSLKSDRMNEIIKVLTLVSTFFMPLSFIVGLYGMNFKYIPELNWRYGYAYCWALMIFVTAFMWWYFKKKKWW
jgi:magnesium transporter